MPSWHGASFRTQITKPFTHAMYAVYLIQHHLNNFHFLRVMKTWYCDPPLQITLFE